LLKLVGDVCDTLNGVKSIPVLSESPVRTFFTEMVERSELLRIASMTGVNYVRGVSKSRREGVRDVESDSS
jgi:hypothetical protein